MKIVSWNVNSLKVRLPQVISWLEQHQPDVLALQETKLIDSAFPVAELEALGYQLTFSGQPTYNGVAIISKHPITDIVTQFSTFDDVQKRLLAVTINGVRIVNVYVPNGAAVDSDKYHYKLNWLQHLQLFIQTELKQHEKLLILGDFNIAPTDEDVHDPIAWEGQVLVSPLEREQLKNLVTLGLQDAFRLFKRDEKVYSWWDYRMMAFRRNRGLRIDLVLLSDALAKICTACEIDKEPRKHERPSDHAPVSVELNLSA